MEKELSIRVLEDKLMKVYAMVDGSVRRKGSTEEKKISKNSEAKRRILGLRERETLALHLGLGELSYILLNLRMTLGCLLNLSGYLFPNL